MVDGIESQGQPDNSGQVDTGQQQESHGGQSPYSQYLERLPEGMRPVVEPIFREWDGNVTRQFQTYSQQLQSVEPYRQFIDSYEPEALQQAIQVAQLIDSQPEEFLQMLAEGLGYQIGDQGEEEEGTPQQFDLSQDPAFRQLQEGVGGLAEFLQQQQITQQQQQEEQQVAQEMTQLIQQAGGNFNQDDEIAVLSLAAQTGDLAGAVQYVASMKQGQQMATNRQQAPVVGGSSGGVQSPNTDVAKWTEQQRKEAAIAMISAANQQRG